MRARVDHLFHAVTGISIFFFTLITVAARIFVWKYRARPGHTAQPSSDHNSAARDHLDRDPGDHRHLASSGKGSPATSTSGPPPETAYEVQVLGPKWKWLFTYPNGVVDDDLHVPPDEPVRLVMTSQDVIHSLYVPEFRIKRDAVPGRYEGVVPGAGARRVPDLLRRVLRDVALGDAREGDRPPHDGRLREVA